MKLVHPHETKSEDIPLSGLFVPPKGDLCFINDLPPELLSRIFDAGSAEKCNIEDAEEYTEYNLRDDEDKEDTDVESSSGSVFTRCAHYSFPLALDPVVLKEVCTHWNNVALSTPSLWSEITFHRNSRPPYAHQLILLEEGKNHPIDIFIRFDENSDDAAASAEADLIILLAMVIPHIHRWRTLEIFPSEYRIMYACLTALSDPSIPAAPQLKTLKLSHFGGSEDLDHFEFPEMSKHFTLFGGSAPLLTRLVLWGVHVDWNQPWIASASNLRDLELHCHTEDVRPSWAEFDTILRGASALERLELRLSGPPGNLADWFIQPTTGNHTDIDGPIPLPRLRELLLVYVPEANAIALFRNLHLPALKKLVLDMEDHANLIHELVRPATSLSPFGGQPRSLLSQLDKFEIIGLSCSAECVEMLYTELQNLTSLNLWLRFIPKRFLDIFCTNCTANGLGDVWLPRLTTLRIIGGEGGVICDVVRKRKDMGVPLDALYLDKYTAVKREDAKWLKENMKTFKFFSY